MTHASILKAISLHLFLFLLNWYIEAALFFILLQCPLLSSHFQFLPHPWSEVTKPTNTMHLWHVLWESDMALVITHFWIHSLCLTPGDWNNSYLSKWILVWDKMLSERYECQSVCTCAFVYVQVRMMKMSALNCPCWN